MRKILYLKLEKKAHIMFDFPNLNTFANIVPTQYEKIRILNEAL